MPANGSQLYRAGDSGNGPTTTATPPPGRTPPLMTVEQVAEHLGTPVRFVRRLVAERRIAFSRVGRYVRISADDLDAFIAAGHIERHR